MRSPLAFTAIQLSSVLRITRAVHLRMSAFNPAESHARFCIVEIREAHPKSWAALPSLQQSGFEWRRRADPSG